jgi:hypothetical protein
MTEPDIRTTTFRGQRAYESAGFRLRPQYRGPHAPGSRRPRDGWRIDGPGGLRCWHGALKREGLRALARLARGHLTARESEVLRAAREALALRWQDLTGPDRRVADGLWRRGLLAQTGDGPRREFGVTASGIDALRAWARVSPRRRGA